VAYQWPEDEAGAALEQLLEQLLERETLSGSEQVEEEEIDPDTIIEVEEETENIDITSDNTYWVADIGRTEDAGSGELIVLEPDLWAVDLLMRFDGTAQFRDVHEGVCLIDDSYLNLTWERTPEGKYLFYSAIVEGPVFIAAYDDGTLIVEYLGMNFYMEQEAVPQSAGQMQIPAELDGTWLMVSGENEGYQWEAMPGELSSLVIGVTSIDGPLVLAADMETRDYYGDLMDSAYGLEVEVLDEPLYTECSNDAWSVRIGEMAEVDENGYPMETEYYALRQNKDQYMKMEETLKRAIVMAEKTSEQIKLTAYQERDIIVSDAKKNANRIVNESLLKAEQFQREADRLRRNVIIYKKRLRDVIETQLQMVDDIEKIELE